MPFAPSTIAGIGVGPWLLHVRRLEDILRSVRAATGLGPVLLGGVPDEDGVIASHGASDVLRVRSITEVKPARSGALVLRLRVIPVIGRADPAFDFVTSRLSATGPSADPDPDALVVEPSIATAAPSFPRCNIATSAVGTFAPQVGVDGRRWGRHSFPFATPGTLFPNQLIAAARDDASPDALPKVGNTLRSGLIPFTVTVAVEFGTSSFLAAALVLTTGNPVALLLTFVNSRYSVPLDPLSFALGSAAPAVPSSTFAGHAIPCNDRRCPVLRVATPTDRVSAALPPFGVTGSNITSALTAPKPQRAALEHEAVRLGRTDKDKSDRTVPSANGVSALASPHGHAHGMAKSNFASHFLLDVNDGIAPIHPDFS